MEFFVYGIVKIINLMHIGRSNLSQNFRQNNWPSWHPAYFQRTSVFFGFLLYTFGHCKVRYDNLESKMLFFEQMFSYGTV